MCEDAKEELHAVQSAEMWETSQEMAKSEMTDLRRMLSACGETMYWRDVIAPAEERVVADFQAVWIELISELGTAALAPGSWVESLQLQEAECIYH